MINLPYAYVTYCDDIRHEVDGKFSLMGVYGKNLLVFGDFPITLPKFIIVINYLDDPDNPPDSIKIRVYFPGDDLDNPSIEGSAAISENLNHIKYPDEMITIPYGKFVFLRVK